MERYRPCIVFFLIADVIVLVIACLHLPSLVARARSPLPVETDRYGELRLTEGDTTATPVLLAGDRITGWNGTLVNSTQELELRIAFGDAGDTAYVSVERNGFGFSSLVTLPAYYAPTGIVLLYVIAFASWGLGLYLLLRRPDDLRALALQTALVSLAAVLVMAWEGFPRESIARYAGTFMFFYSYLTLAVSFLVFTLVFPVRKNFPAGLVAATLALLCVISSFLLTMTLASAHREGTYALFLALRRMFDPVVASILLAGIVTLGHSYATAPLHQDRRTLRLIFAGIAAGALPFLLGTKVAGLVDPRATVSENITLPFLLIIPATFVVSFMHHRLLDIDLVIRKTLQYAIVMVLVAVLYTALVGFTVGIVTSSTPVASVLVALLVAFLFEPLRKQSQRLIDGIFFRRTYDPGVAQQEFLSDVRLCVDVPGVARMMLHRIREAVPLAGMAFMSVREGGRLERVAQEGSLTLPAQVRFAPGRGVATCTGHMAARDGACEPEVQHARLEHRVFERRGVMLVVPLVHSPGTVSGVVLLDAKLSGKKFTSVDIALLTGFGATAAAAIERFRLQREVIVKEEEARQWKQLNQMKSDFLGFVSHDLRTPLTSIRMFAELLLTRRHDDPARTDRYLGTIIGESERLNRMVVSLLDAQSIDQGGKQYHMSACDLRRVASDVMESMQHQFDQGGFSVTCTLPDRPVLLTADRDALRAAVLNLVTNAIKYSGTARDLAIQVGSNGTTCALSVADQGIGMDAGTVGHIFDKFYRHKDVGERIPGVGMGLAIVRHVVDAHGGTIAVQSTPGRGSTFTLTFPQIRNNSPEEASCRPY